jgi:chloramphenicol 3-O phosphotransferase
VTVSDRTANFPVPGTIVILNGPPRAGKSSIAHAIQEAFDGVWINLGVDAHAGMLPDRYQPGIGLRPGGERPDLEPLVALLFEALYQSVAVHSRLGLNVVVDIGHHDVYAVPLDTLSIAARYLAGLPVLFVGVRCSLDVILERRSAGQIGREGRYLTATSDATVPAPIRLWQTAAHDPGLYDLEVNSSDTAPDINAELIRQRLSPGIGESRLFDPPRPRLERR